MFRSTGSYEPDRSCRTSMEDSFSFDPQALTSLTTENERIKEYMEGFDPQALTSLTNYDRTEEWTENVSIHRLLRA